MLYATVCNNLNSNGIFFGGKLQSIASIKKFRSMTWLAYIIAAQAEAMYSPYSRLNAIGAYASFVLSVLIVGNIVTSWFIPSNVTGSLTVSLLDGP